MRGYKGGTRGLIRAMASELRRQEQSRRNFLDAKVEVDAFNETSVDEIVGQYSEGECNRPIQSHGKVWLQMPRRPSDID